MAGRECLYEPEHARFLQVRKFSPAKFPSAGGAHWFHLSAAASRYSFARRHFLLHVPFAFLHARHLPRRIATDAIAARFRSRGLVFPAVGRRADRARGRFSSATRDRKSTRLNSSHVSESRMPSS